LRRSCSAFSNRLAHDGSDQFLLPAELIRRYDEHIQRHQSIGKRQIDCIGDRATRALDGHNDQYVEIAVIAVTRARLLCTLGDRGVLKRTDVDSGFGDIPHVSRYVDVRQWRQPVAGN